MNAGHLIAELPTLFDGLERAGFTVTVQSRLAVHDLLLRLAVEGSLPGNADALGRMIGPIVCTSPSEQEQFESLFQQWQQQFTDLENDPPKAPPVKSGIEKTPAKRSENARPFLTGVVIAAVVVLAVWNNERRFEESHSTNDFAPMSQLGPNSDQSDSAVNPQEKHQHDSDDTDIQPKQPDESKTQGEQPQEPESPASQDSSLLKEAGANSTEPELITETHTTESKPRFGLAAAVTGIGLLLCILAVCTCWWLSAHWRKRFLVKRSVSHHPEMEHLAVQCNTKGNYGNSFWRTAQRFRQHLSRSSHRLDVSRTAARTAANGGLFTPVRAEEKVSPSYLMLIESDGRRDQQTQVIDSLVDQLESEGVAVTRYYFRGDPRICRQPGGRAKRLTELAAGHHSDRLMVFADARSFLDPLTGAVSPWIEAFESWSERALMVAAESENWSSAEATMSEHFRLAPANSSGLASLVEQFTPDLNLTRQIGNDRYPAMLREHPERWLDREAPSQESLDKLLDQLREYLGKAGYQWLSACAVYPTLHHRLTLWTGESLTDEHNRPLVNDSDLMRISRLPWLRQGQLPDWLRTRLIADLSEQQELAIRNRLDKLFRSALAQPEAVTTLRIARDTGNLQQDRRNRGRILRDHTFISFMSNPLSVRVPRTLGRMLPFQRDWQPRRVLAAIALLMFLFTASAFLLAPAGQATTIVSSTNVPPPEPQLAQKHKDTSSGTSTVVSGSDEASSSAATGVREVAGERPFVPGQVFYMNELNDNHDVQFAVRTQITSVSDAVVGEDMEVTAVIVNNGEVEVPSTAVVEVRYVGAFELTGILRTLGVPIPPGDSREITFRHIAALKNDFALEVKVHADDRREQLLAESNEFRVHAYAPISAPIPTVSDEPQKSAHIAVKGPTQATVGQEVKVKIIVTNSGTVALKSVVIRNEFDQGLTYVGSGEFEYERWQMENYSSAERAKINAALNRPADAPLVSDLAGHQPITKSIGKLAAGESRLVAVRFLTTEPGKLCQTIQVLDVDRLVTSTQHCLNSPNSQWRRDTVESGILPEQRYSQSVPQVQQRGLPPWPPNARPPIGNPPVLPSLPLPDRAQQTRGPVQRTDDTIRIRLNEPKLPLVPPQDREPYVIEFSDDFNFDARLMSALKSWRPFIIIKTDATSQQALGTRIRDWVAAWNEGRLYAKPPKLRGTPREIRFGTEASRLLGNPVAPPTISARNDTIEARVDTLRPYNIATNAGSGQPIQIWLYNRFYTQALPQDLRRANPPALLLPGEQRVVPSTAGDLDVQQRSLR